ncbi:DUF3578 domain-containing protein [Hafnia paralvei]|nr:DUF3578 domain-containing protein [Hafnia paralvei]RDA71366.1 DUF3578 domain-containing protein [Hafnia paralvei]RDA72484.1 DUF3578 domain-containing protein [Hafnia paralvei]RDA80572.1 DUF3578 domain-containing protein [Hafnia paralvei]RDA80957.1 DUF3578 domain-containing protein [Hafnia paralvei]
MDMELLRNVLANYSEMRQKQNGRTCSSEGTIYPSVAAIMEALPSLFRQILSEHGRENEFKVTGSFGQGAISEIPWVGIFNKNITTSAQKGYYIVLLFSADMSSCSLSLNQAVTAYSEKYSGKMAIARMRETAAIAKEFIAKIPGTIVGPISLKASKKLGKGYESGAIQSFNYDYHNLPDKETFVKNFLSLLSNYNALYTLSGASLSSLSSYSEELYQEHALQLASEMHLDSANVDKEPGGIPVPPKKLVAGRETYTRDDKVAAAAISKASFLCELDPSHITFVSSANNKNYVEAHHLIPMGKQDQFDFSLDVAANVVALCPTCHRLLHHGKMADKKILLTTLLSKRKQQLENQKIEISTERLLDFYSKSDIPADH